MTDITEQKKKEMLYEDICDMKSGSFEEMWLVTFYSLSSYFQSLFSFGYKSKVTKDNLNVIKEMFQILYTERKLLNYIIKNLDKFNVDSTERVVAILDELNDKTLNYYYNVIDDIEEAAELKNETRGIRLNKDFSTLLQTNSYTNEVIALALDKNMIKSFLGYEDEFWVFVNKTDYKTMEAQIDLAEKLTYVAPIYDKNDIVVDVKFYVPEVIDLPTALLAIQTYQRIYDIYKHIGKKIDELEKTDVSKKQEEFQQQYLPKITQFSLNKKKQS